MLQTSHEHVSLAGREIAQISARSGHVCGCERNWKLESRQNLTKSPHTSAARLGGTEIAIKTFEPATTTTTTAALERMKSESK
jgi:hypothetical protein